MDEIDFTNRMNNAPILIQQRSFRRRLAVVFEISPPCNSKCELYVKDDAKGEDGEPLEKDCPYQDAKPLCVLMQYYLEQRYSMLRQEILIYDLDEPSVQEYIDVIMPLYMDEFLLKKAKSKFNNACIKTKAGGVKVNPLIRATQEIGLAIQRAKKSLIGSNAVTKGKPDSIEIDDFLKVTTTVTPEVE